MFFHQGKTGLILLKRYLVVTNDMISVDTTAVIMAVSVKARIAVVSGMTCKILASQKYWETPVRRLPRVMAAVTLMAEGWLRCFRAWVPFRTRKVVTPRTTQGRSMRKPRRGETKEYATPPITVMSRADSLVPMDRMPRVRMVAKMGWVAWFRKEEKYEVTTRRDAITMERVSLAAFPVVGFFVWGVFIAVASRCCCGFREASRIYFALLEKKWLFFNEMRKYYRSNEVLILINRVAADTVTSLTPSINCTRLRNSLRCAKSTVCTTETISNSPVF